jgi:outer membrane lipoprotein SlyB
MKKQLFVSLGLMVTLLSGCGHNVSTNTYQAAEVGVVSKVLTGVIIAERCVAIDASNHVGGLAGAGAGAVAGSTLGGSGQGNIVGAIGGAVVGGLVGHSIDKAVNKKKGMEYIIRLKDGCTISVTQLQDLDLSIGQHVLIIYGATTRVVPDETIAVEKHAK